LEIQKELQTMAITVLNNISDLTAEQALGNTQMSLQKTLTQLSTGLKINSGSDDAAGLSIANGMTANIAALTQSQQNASNGVGLLQTADGALSQVTTLLNRAVTIATEGSSNSITSTQSTALDTEFQSIMSEVNQIGQTTNFNGQNVFANNSPSTFTSTQASLVTGTTLTSGDKTTITDSATGGTFVYTATGSSTVSTLQAAITAAVSAGTLSAGTALTLTGGHAVITNTAATGIDVSSNDAVLGAFTGSATASATNTVFISDSSTVNASINTEITTTINPLSSTQLSLNTSSLTSATNSQAALTAINAAISSVSAQRGSIGASVNRLNAASTVMSDQVTNLQSAVNSLQDADVATTVANMTQYNVLESTGMAALQQANQAQQAVLKLVQ
jgi:flagellin